MSHVILRSLVISKSRFEICFQKKKIFAKQKMKFVSISVRIYAIFSFLENSFGFQKCFFTHVKKGGKKLLRKVKTSLSKSMDLQLSNAVSHVILRGLVISETFIEF